MSTWPERSVRTESLLAILAVAVCAAHVWRYSGMVLDDTYISLRYAQNFVDGHGLVFNPGERVEGYTNFSMVLFNALCLRLGVEPILAMKVLLVGASAWALLLTGALDRALRQNARRALAPLFLLPLEAWIYWSFCTMESMLFAALLITAVLLLLLESREGRWRGSTLVFVALALTRPEGVLLFALCTGAFCLTDLVRDRQATPLRKALVNGLIFSVLYGSYFLWRYLYYGSLLPNTFYAKVTGGEGQWLNGLRHFREFATAFPLFALMLIAPLPMLVRDAVRRDRNWYGVTALYCVVVVYTGYVVSVGGDFMPFFRFFIPILPLYAVLLGWLLLGDRRRVPAAVLVAFWLVHVAASLNTEQPYRAFVAHRTALVGISGGKWFREKLAPDDLIAVNTAGSLPYYSQRPSLDTLGLTDAAIAHRPIYIVSEGWAGHRRGWGDYVLSRKPRVVLWYNASGSREPFYLGDHELAGNPYFRFFYQLRTITLPPDGPTGTTLEQFLGFPFGYSDRGSAPMSDLGLQARFESSWPARTIFTEGPILLTYFERKNRDAELWELVQPGGDVDAFVERVAERWLRERPALGVGPETERRKVEALCDEARKMVDAQNIDAAKRLLSQAAQLNETARSPLVYQYIANLGVLVGDVFVAAGAQREALRLAPDSELYRSNLKSVLRAPYKKPSQTDSPGRKREEW